MAANHEARAARGQENRGWLAAITGPAILFPLLGRRLVRSTGKSDAHRKLLEGAAAIARALGPAVVAKGVQSGAEAALLDRELFDEAQGINYGEPLPADRVFELLRPRDSTAPPAQLPTATVDRR